MATLTSSLFFIGLVIISSFVKLSLCSNTFKDENPIRLISDGFDDSKSYAFSIMDDNDDDDDEDDHDDVDDLSHARLSRHSIEAIYQFGDSLSDTGNFKWENPSSSFAQFPYGETYFHKPTGRCSDGLLIIDHLAKFLNLPFLDAYLNQDGNFAYGANFAVIGATALDVSTLVAKNIKPTVTNHSLSVQLGWFKSHLSSVCSDTSECKSKLAKSLFLVGEIGGNDYNFAIFGGKPPQDVYQMVPEVVQAISNVVEEVISLGATQVVVPGNFPIGCMTVYLAAFKSNDSAMYDELKCFKSLNKFAKFHNDQLRQSIKNLRKSHRHVTIVYMDLAKPLKKILKHATSLGFDKEVLYKTCCGIGDDEYNFNSSKICGVRGVPPCEHPKKHVNWDGFHLTDHAYQVIAKWFIKHNFGCSSSFS